MRFAERFLLLVPPLLLTVGVSVALLIYSPSSNAKVKVSAAEPVCAAPEEIVSLAGNGFGGHNVKIEVGDLIAEVVEATGHSAEFVVPPDAQLGLTTVTATNPGGQGDSIDFQVKGLEICGNNIDDDCDYAVDEVDECPLTSIEIDTSPFDIAMAPEEVSNISTTITFITTSSDPFTITVTQQIVPLAGPSGGISISPNVVGGFVASTDHATVDNQEITAYSDGVYEITTTAEIVETGEVTSASVIIAVESISQTMEVWAPGATPPTLAPNSINAVVFSSQVSGVNSSDPITVSLDGDLHLILNDQGMDGDLIAGDGSFSGTALVDTTGKSIGTCLHIYATATQTTDVETSEMNELCVSSLPVYSSPSDLGNRVPDPINGGSVIANEAIIIVDDEVSDSQILQIADSVKSVVVGSIPEANAYQLRLQKTVSNKSQLDSVLSELVALPEVLFAAPNPIYTASAVTPSDIRFPEQTGLQKIRADEAWVVARGGKTIAIIDSGADLDHPDLKDKLIVDKDYVDDDFNPEDENGHGTHVAGIVAADSNSLDAEGVSGISWDSKLLIIRVGDENNVSDGGAVIQAIIRAARKGARIINVSMARGPMPLGGYFDVTCVGAGIARSLYGSLVVAGAGNGLNNQGLGVDVRHFPAACPGVLAVGATTNTDTRASFSNFGSWVDLAAPGENILSTLPKGGYGRLSGTSMATPMVSGAAAVLLSRQPGLSNSEVETRLKRTAVKLMADQELGAGRIDLFEAVFNGSFEEGNLALWDRQGTTSSKTGLGSIVPQHRRRMGSVSTGPAGAQTAGTLMQSFTIQPGVDSFPISFKYTFVTEEYPEFIGTIFDDSLRITLVTPSGAEIILAEESVNASSFQAIGGIDFQGGDNTVGWTDWKLACQENIPVTDGPGTYKILLEDAGDSIYDTETLVDEIKFKLEENNGCP